MAEFFRFPHTPHVAWLSVGLPRDDKVLSPAEAHALLSGEVVVEEKLDGANLGISVENGELRLQNRGAYLHTPYHGQFSRAKSWIEGHQYDLMPALGDTLILFGEWCAARHSVAYDHLPDWFVAFDIYDRAEKRFWSTNRRNTWASGLDISAVPMLYKGSLTFAALKELVLTRTSCFDAGNLEGVVVRRESKEFLDQRAKLVHPDFAQSLGEHWRQRIIEWNTVASV